jgi:hypothetical protein
MMEVNFTYFKRIVIMGLIVFGLSVLIITIAYAQKKLVFVTPPIPLIPPPEK